MGREAVLSLLFIQAVNSVFRFVKKRKRKYMEIISLPATIYRCAGENRAKHIFRMWQVNMAQPENL